MPKYPMYFILQGRNVIESDIATWSRFFSEFENRSIAYTVIPDHDIEISTVFIGLEGGLFETLISGGPLHEYRRRYMTYDEAEQGHEHLYWLCFNHPDLQKTNNPLKRAKMGTINTDDIKTPALVDAVAAAAANPQTFKLPELTQLREIITSTLDEGKPVIPIYLQICAEDERFWVLVQSYADDDNLIGTVDNDLLNTERHQLRDGDNIKFKLTNVYKIL